MISSKRWEETRGGAEAVSITQEGISGHVVLLILKLLLRQQPNCRRETRRIS